MQIHLTSILLWGFIGTILLTTILSASHQLGWSRMSLPYILGTMVTPNRYRANLIGFLLHFLNGWLFSVVYAFVFESWGEAGWWRGAILGFIHGMFALVAVIPLLPGIHPRMASEHRGPTPTRELEPPGFMALNYGHRTPIVTIIAHLVYGGVLGAFY